MDRKESAVIRKQYEKAMRAFTKKKFDESIELLKGLIDKYRDVDGDLTQQIISEAKIKLSIIDGKLNPKKIELNEPEDILSEGVYQLNAGNSDSALELFKQLLDKKYKISYVQYLMSIAFLKGEDVESSLKYLENAIELDDYYRILAYNESDFEPLSENEEFINMLEVTPTEL